MADEILDSEVDLEALEEAVVEKKIDLGLNLQPKESDVLLKKAKHEYEDIVDD